MTAKRCSIPLMFCLVLLTITRVHATTVQRLELHDLVEKAHAIVVGKVTASRTYWSAGKKIILTNYTIEVDESIKGRGMRTIEVTTVGGRIGDVELHVSGMPAFQKGENAVLFIEQSGAYQTVVGLGQGKFTVINGEVANSVGGLSFPDGLPGKPVKMPLATFKTQIRTFLAR